MVCPVGLRLTAYRDRALYDSGRRFCEILGRGVVLVWDSGVDCLSGGTMPGD